MPGMVLIFPILAGKVEAWRRFCQELSGSRLQMYITSRRRLDITYERLALAETTFGPVAVTTLEAADVERALGQIIISKLPFDRWYRERVEVLHGINLARYGPFSQRIALPENQEQLFEWALSSTDG
ncbi:MAG: hypothetical protein ACOYYS_23005 [Chloroflexota bacterium]